MAFALATTLAMALAATGAALHDDGPGQAAVPNTEPYPPAGGIQPILDLAASALLPGYAFAQSPPDSTPPTFVSSELDSATGVLAITFSEDIDATPATSVVPDKIHIRESGSYTDGVTLGAGELATTVDGTVISFTLTESNLAAVKGLTVPELTIDPGAVQDTSGNLIASTFDISTASFTNSFDISSQIEYPQGVAFSSDGAKMFIADYSGKGIYEYTLTTPFDVSAASAGNFSVAPLDISPSDVAFSNNGTKMFVVDYDSAGVYEYTLSTPFDISAPVIAGNFSVSTQDQLPEGVAFSNDGTKMFMIGDGSNAVHEYTLTAPFAVSNATFVGSFSIVSETIQPDDVAFSNDGTKMFVVDISDAVHEYALTAPFDVSAAAFANSTFDSSPHTNALGGMAFSNDGTKMFLVNLDGDAVNEYALSSVYPITVIRDPATDFVTTWRTDAANESVTIPVLSTLTYDYTVIWGDGTNDTGVTGDATHPYAAAGDYQVRIYGTYPQIYLNDHADASKLISIDRWGSNRWVSMISAFRGASSMTYNAADTPDLSGVTDMSHMFRGATSFNANISGWNVSGVTEMPSMFRGATSFNGDISDWNVSGVTSMNSMFRNATSFNGDISDWNVSGVTSMSRMFFGATSFNGDISGWIVSGVTDMFSIFGGATSFNGDISGWDVSEVTNMYNMFNGATSFSRNLGNWYIVLDETAIDLADTGNTIGSITAQNLALDGHSPVYGLGSDSDSQKFAISGSDLQVKPGEDYSSGTYDVAITATGAGLFGTSNQRTVGVTVTDTTPSDTTPPTLALIGLDPETITVGTPYTDAGATCTDDVDGAITPTSSGTVDASQAGTYTVTYSCQDAAGNSAPDVSRDVIVSAAVISTGQNPPTFVSSTLNATTGVLAITFSEEIDATPATNVVPARIHIRESGNYTDGITLSDGELGTATDGTVISFTLTAPHLAAVKGLTVPELTIEPGAVRDTSGNLIVGTFDLSTAVFADSTFSVSTQSANPRGMAFSSNGTKMFVVDYGLANVYEYTLSTPFDISAPAFVNSFSVSSQDTSPNDVAFSNDGTKMFVVGYENEKIFEYTLTPAFDLSSVTLANNITITQDIYPDGMAFSNDGTKMFVAGGENDSIYEYAMSTAFDVSTANFTDTAFSVTAQETSPSGMEFSSDGTKMFVVGVDKIEVHQYALSTPFDISAPSIVHSFNVSSQDIYPEDVAFSNDGAKMFVVGNIGGDINEYALSSVYPITVTDTTPIVNTYPATDFVTTWRTDAANESVTIQVQSSLTYDYTVIWGDGTNSTDVTGDATHPYATAGDHQVRVYGTYPQIYLNDHADASKLISIDQWGSNQWASMNSAFRGASNMEYNATDTPDLSGVTSMQSMFRDATSFNGDLSSWNVSGVTDMSYMFASASAFNQPLNDWNVAAVTDMSDMFTSATDFNQPLNDWNVSAVTDMSHMFSSTGSFNQPLSAWNVSAVTDMSSMFDSATSFDGDISAWNVSAVTDMSGMFAYGPFDQPLASWNVSAVTDMSGMFEAATSFNRPLSSWNVSAVTDMFEMFLDADDFDQNLGNWYIVPDETAIDLADAGNTIGPISAQNSVLDGHGPVYGLGSDSDSQKFAISGSDLQVKPGEDYSSGTYDVTITATGAGLFGTSNQRTVGVTVTDTTPSDTTPPTLALIGLDPETITVGTPYTDAGATCTDDVDGAITPTSSGTVDASQAGTYTVTYSCQDAAGNSAPDVSRDVIVSAAVISTGQGPPTFVSSTLNATTGVLAITFSEEIDATPATNVVPARIHIRESGSYTDGVTLGAGELDTTVDGTVISFNLTAPHLAAVKDLTVPELTIEPGAVKDTSGDLIVGTLDISTASFVSATSVSLHGMEPSGMAFSSNGTKMFVVDFDSDSVNEYTLSTPFDISAPTLVHSFNVSSYADFPVGVVFSNDGFKMYMLGYEAEKIFEYTLTTAFDVSTASFSNSTSVESQDIQPEDVALSNDGTKMLLIGSKTDRIYEYAMSTAFDVSTANFTDTAFSVSSQETNPTGMEFSNDGTKMFVLGHDSLSIHQYALSAPFDISAPSIVRSFNASSQDSKPEDVAFSNDGAKMFVVGYDAADINEYALSSVYPITVIRDPATDFVTTWRTDAASQDVIIQVQPSLTYNYTVIWGDGTNSTGVPGNATHTYAAAGDHQVRIYGTYPGIYLNGHFDASKLISIDQWGSNRWASMASAFRGASNMEYNAADTPDLSDVTDMSYMFRSAASFDGDLSSWDVSGGDQHVQHV